MKRNDHLRSLRQQLRLMGFTRLSLRGLRPPKGFHLLRWGDVGLVTIDSSTLRCSSMQEMEHLLQAVVAQSVGLIRSFDIFIGLPEDELTESLQQYLKKEKYRIIPVLTRADVHQLATELYDWYID